jgi:hypothetical protein
MCGTRIQHLHIKLNTVLQNSRTFLQFPCCKTPPAAVPPDFPLPYKRDLHNLKLHQLQYSF